MREDFDQYTYLSESKQRIATLVAGLTVGDVLHEVIMWENTANIFYQVVEIDDRTVSYRRLKVNAVSEVFGYGRESPIVNSFFDDVIIKNDKRWIGKFIKWNGKPAYYSYAN